MGVDDDDDTDTECPGPSAPVASADLAMYVYEGNYAQRLNICEKKCRLEPH